MQLRSVNVSQVAISKKSSTLLSVLTHAHQNRAVLTNKETTSGEQVSK